jgi:hypothetical protein
MAMPGRHIQIGSDVAGTLEVGEAVAMAKKPPDDCTQNGPEAKGSEKLTVFGEPLWLDVLKTLGVAIALLSVTVVVGGLLGVAIMAPWGRASPDCSIYCVLERHIEGFFSDKPS